MQRGHVQVKDQVEESVCWRVECGWITLSGGLAVGYVGRRRRRGDGLNVADSQLLPGEDNFDGIHLE